MTYAKLSPRSIRMLGPSLAFCFVCAASVVAQARFDRAALIAAVDRAAGAAVEEHRLPGAGLVLVHAGKTMHARGFGVSNLTTKAPVDPDRTIFRIGSISKALSLLTLARFVDKGRIRMDTPVGGFVDGIRNPIGFDDPVRIRHLLTHTTGFDQLGGADRQIRNYSAELDARIAARPSLRSYLEGGRLRRVSRAGLYYRYDTYGSSLAGLVLEKLTGLSFRDAMRKELFEPLGMASSFVETDASERERLAIGYEERDGRMEAQPYEVYLTTPASSIDATVADMGRLLEALTGGGANEHGRLFGAEMARAVLEPQFRPHEAFLGTSHGLHESRDISRRFEVPIRTVDHGGTMAGFKSLLAVLPRYRLGIYVVTNKSGGGRNPFAAAVMHAIAQNVQDPPKRERHSVPEVDEETDLSAYAGDYYYGVYAHTASVEEVADGAWPRGRPRRVRADKGRLRIGDELYLPRGDDVFVREDGERLVFFARDEGRIASFNYSSSADSFEREDPRLPYVQFRSLAQAVYEVASTRGGAAAIEQFRALRAGGEHYLREAEMNNAGYALLEARRVADAIALFRLNVEAFPKSANAHDSLGEALATNGDTKRAIESYERSVELDPANAGGKAALERLKKKASKPGKESGRESGKNLSG